MSQKVYTWSQMYAFLSINLSRWEIQLSENRLTAEKVNRKHEEQSAVALDARERVESA